MSTLSPALHPVYICPVKFNMHILDVIKKDLDAINKQTENTTQTKAEAAKSQQVKDMMLFVHA